MRFLLATIVTETAATAKIGSFSFMNLFMCFEMT